MESLKQIVESTDTKSGRRFDKIIQALIALSVVCFCIETLLPKSSNALINFTKTALYIIHFYTVAIFTVEYLLRILVADRKFKYIFSFFGLVDLLAIVPSYITLASTFKVKVNLLPIRIVRGLLLFRTMKMLRYSRAIRRFKAAFSGIKEELILCFITTGLMMFVATIGIYYCEKIYDPERSISIFDSLWLAIGSITTAATQDPYPVTLGGRLFTALLFVFGLAAITVPSALLASSWTHLTKDSG